MRIEVTTITEFTQDGGVTLDTSDFERDFTLALEEACNPTWTINMTSYGGRIVTMVDEIDL